MWEYSVICSIISKKMSLVASEGVPFISLRYLGFHLVNYHVNHKLLRSIQM
jgi:hypothetical protein